MASDPAATLDAIVRGVELIALLGGGIAIVYRVGGAVSKFEQIGKQQAGEISDIKTNLSKMNDAVGVLMQQKAEFNYLNERQMAQGRRLDDLFRFFMSKVEPIHSDD